MVKKLSLCILCLFTLNACSVKLAYNFLDFAINWQIGKYVTLTSKQQSIADKRIEAFHDWHRATQLPLYANYIDGLIARMETDQITADWVHKETDKIQDLLDLSVKQIKPDLVTLIASFDEKQVAEVMERFEKERDKYQKKHIDISEKKLLKRRKNELTDYLGPFFGHFTSEQKQWIDEWAHNLEPYEALTLKQQELWAIELKEALNARKNEEELSKRLDGIMLYRTDDWDPKLEEILDKNQDLTYNLIAKLLNNRTEKQRTRFVRKLSAYRDDLNELSSKSK